MKIITLNEQWYTTILSHHGADETMTDKELTVPGAIEIYTNHVS